MLENTSGVDYLPFGGEYGADPRDFYVFAERRLVLAERYRQNAAKVQAQISVCQEGMRSDIAHRILGELQRLMQHDIALAEYCDAVARRAQALGDVIRDKKSQSTLAVSAALLAGGGLVGCSTTADGSEVADGSHANTGDAGSVGEERAVAESQADDPKRQKTCRDLVTVVSSFQRNIIYDGLEEYSSAEHQRDEIHDIQIDGAEPWLAQDGDPEAMRIAVAASPDPHSKEIHRRVKGFCGPYFDKAVAQNIKSQESGEYLAPFTPDWSV